MIKRLLITGLFLMGLATANAQETAKVYDYRTAEAMPRLHAAANKPSAMPVPESDTLAYFMNKHSAMNTVANYQSFPTYMSPYPSTLTISEFGSSFLNPSGSGVTVYGAYALCLRHQTSISPTVNIRVYIYSANNSGVPVAKLDSAMTSVSQSTSGTFCNATFSTPVSVTGAFYISYKPIVTPGDTIRFFMNNAQASSSVVPITSNYSDGLGFTRVNGNMQPNSGFYGGAGTDKEAIVIPMVAFTYSASAATPPTNTTSPTGYCANVPVTFTSTSTGLLENRQFNWNAFAHKWLPYVNTSSLTVLRVADSIYNYSFNTGTVNTAYARSTNTVSVQWSAPGNTNGTMIAKYQRSNFYGRTTKSQNLFSFASFTVVNCGIVGVNQNFMDINFSIYPNPAINGKTSVNGLEGKNTITVYNMIGQAVSNITTENENEVIDLNNQPAGTYMIRVTDSSNKSKTVKIIKD
jgi:hypothetical protein